MLTKVVQMKVVGVVQMNWTKFIHRIFKVGKTNSMRAGLHFVVV